MELLAAEEKILGRVYRLADSSDSCGSIEGIGLHTGRHYRLKLFRNKSHRSLVFRVCIDGDCFYAPASWSRLSGTARATALVLRSDSGRAAGRVELKTVEHFLAAFHVSGLKGFDAEIEVLGEDKPDRDAAFELPVLDGASRDWMKFFEEQGLLENGKHRCDEGDRVWNISRSYELVDGDRKILLLPSVQPSGVAKTEFHCSVDFPDKWKQNCSFALDWTQVSNNVSLFTKNIAPARTFGFEEELKDLEKRGLAKGGSMKNALLMSKTHVVNPEGFCVPEELAAHKLLDAVGDFALADGAILGQIHTSCAGHSMHLRALTEAIRKGVLVEGIIDRQGRFHRRD